MRLRLATFLIWCLVAGSAVFWGLRLWASGPTAVIGAAPAAPHALLRGDVARVLGREAAAPVAAAPAAVVAPADSRFKLLGVMAPRERGAPEARGLALISIDGAPARAFREGSRVEGTQWLLRVEPRRALLGAKRGASGSAQADALVLELPDPSSSSSPGAATSAMAPGAPAARGVIGSTLRPPVALPGAFQGRAPGAAPPAAPPVTPSTAGASTESGPAAAESQTDTAAEGGPATPTVPMRRPGPALR